MMVRGLIVAMALASVAAPALSQTSDAPPPKVAAPPIPALPSPKPEAPVSPEAQALGAKIAGVLLQYGQPIIEREVDKGLSGEKLGQLGDRAEPFREAVRASVLEAFEAKRPEVASILGHALAERLTLPELKAGARFVESPDADVVFSYYLKRYEGERPAKPAAVVRAEFRLQSTGAGRGFTSSLEHSEALFKGSEGELMAAILPTMALRLADKIDAEEARHAEAAKAAGAVQPSPEALALGGSIVHAALGLVDDKLWSTADVAMTAALSQALAKNPALKAPQEWAPLISQATLDTFRKDQPALERVGGRTLASLYSAEELQTLADFMNSPAPSYFVKSAMAKKRGETVTPPSAEVTAAMDRFKSSGMPQRLTEKLKDKEKLKAAAFDLVFGLAPIWLRNFGEKAETAEAARRAARGW